jgi:Ca2+-transporting ATPase
MAVGTLACFGFTLAQTADPAKASTVAFTTFVFFQFFNIFNARNEARTAFNRQFFSNPSLWWALAVVIALQAVVVHWEPAWQVMDTTALAWQDWVLALTVGSAVLVIEEAVKRWRHRDERHRDDTPGPS